MQAFPGNPRKIMAVTAWRGYSLGGSKARQKDAPLARRCRFERDGAFSQSGDHVLRPRQGDGRRPLPVAQGGGGMEIAQLDRSRSGGERKRCVKGKRVSVRVDLGG